MRKIKKQLRKKSQRIFDFYFNILLYCILFLIVFSCGNSKDRKYLGAELLSKDSVKYGKFEIRMKMAKGSGVISSFFLFANDSWKGFPYEWKEIDTEALGCDSDLVQTNIITGYANRQTLSEERVHCIKSLSADYFIYSLEWTPDYIAWFINHKLIRKTLADENKQVVDLRNRYLSYRFNIWITNRIFWDGIFNKRILPVNMYIDWVKYYTYDSKGNQKFNLLWADEFNGFDNNHWGKGNSTFKGNKAMFDPRNISVKNDQVSLSLTNRH